MTNLFRREVGRQPFDRIRHVQPQAPAEQQHALHSLGVIKNEIDGVEVSIIIVLVCSLQFGVAEVGQGDEFH